LIISKKPPKFALANGMAFGEAPDCMEALNKIGLALISRNRNSSHMFSFYAGQHQSIRGFHTMYQNNVEHTQETLLRMNDRQSPNLMSCMLQGPFTYKQKQKVMETMTVDRDVVLATFDFLRANNAQYYDLPLVIDGNYAFPDPIVVDASVEEANTNDPQEQIFESTVYFPDGNEVSPETGGLGNSQAFTVEYLRRTMSGSTASTITSRPTNEYASDRSISFLVDSFPLQFPYGMGGPFQKRDTPVSYLDCLEYYLRVANKHFMRSDFILIIHSLWEKEKAIRSASMRCGSKQDDVSLASRFAVLDPIRLAEEAQRRLDSRQSRGGQGNNPNTPEKLFFDTLDISCKAMAHTNHASKSARRKMFSLWYTISSPGIFFTISPCDETNFRMRLYIGRAEVCYIEQLYLQLLYAIICLYIYILIYFILFVF
jgi:hypothetical protein